MNLNVSAKTVLVNFELTRIRSANAVVACNASVSGTPFPASRQTDLLEEVKGDPIESFQQRRPLG